MAFAISCRLGGHFATYLHSARAIPLTTTRAGVILNSISEHAALLHNVGHRLVDAGLGCFPLSLLAAPFVICTYVCISQSRSLALLIVYYCSPPKVEHSEQSKIYRLEVHMEVSLSLFATTTVQSVLRVKLPCPLRCVHRTITELYFAGCHCEQVSGGCWHAARGGGSKWSKAPS